MALLRWDPVREMEGIRDGVRRAFEDSLSRMRKEKTETTTARWSPPVDIFHEREAFVLTFDLPGVDKKDIAVKMDGSVLTVRGERRFDKNRKEQDYLRIESAYGVFERSFDLPPTVDPAKTEARLENGVLQIVLPKREETKPRDIQLGIKG